MFQLAKVWIDTIPNPNTVEIRYTWSDLNEKPLWNGEEEAAVMPVVPNTSPAMRLAEDSAAGAESAAADRAAASPDPTAAVEPGNRVVA